MSETKKLSCDQIIHIINETHRIIWEDEAIDHDIDFGTVNYITERLKNIFMDVMTDKETDTDEEPDPQEGGPE